MRKIPKNVPRAPDFDNVDDLIKWYRKAYRLPRTWRKLKGWAGYDQPSPRYTPKSAPSSGFRFIDLAKDVRRSMGSRGLPALRWDDIQRRTERGSRMGRMSTNYLKKEIGVLKHVETELKKIEKYSKVNRTPNLLKGALGRASIFLSVLIPTSEIISEEQEMQHLQEYVPPHLDKVRGYSNVGEIPEDDPKLASYFSRSNIRWSEDEQRQLQRLYRNYYNYSDPMAGKTKKRRRRFKKGGKVSWNY